MSGCHAPASADPAAVFQSIRNDFVQGNLDVALARAGTARRDFAGAAVAADAGADPGWDSKFLLLEAEILLSEKRFAEVVALLAGGAFPTSGDLAIKRDLLRARAHSRLDRRQESAQELAEARSLAESSKSPLIGDVLRVEALVALDDGRWDEAMRNLKSSLAVAREHGDVFLEASDLVDVGYVSMQMGRYDQAVIVSGEAAKSAEAIQARNQILSARGNMGWSYLNLGEFELGLANLQEAETQAKALGLTRARVIWLQDAGLAEYKLGNLAEARKYDEEALRAALSLPAATETDHIVNIETNLGLLLNEQGDYDAAKALGDKARLAAQNSKDGTVVAYAMFLQGLLAARQDRDPNAERLLIQARQVAADADLQMNIENALANFYSARHDARQAESWYRRSIQTFENNRSSVENRELRMSFFATGDTAYRDYAEFLVDSGRPIEALQLLDRSRARTLQEGLGLLDDGSGAQPKSPPNAQALARKLGAPILFYSLGPQRSHLWVINTQETRLFTLPKQKDIQSLIESYQKAIQNKSDPLQTTNGAAISLYDILIKPAAGLIPEDSKVFLIPDGVLHALNFETLVRPTANGLEYWIEHVTVTITSSIRMLSRSTDNAAESTDRNLLLIGNPITAASQFQPLRHASDEVQRIQHHFSLQGRTVLTAAQAVPSAYLESRPERFQYIHFVAHGVPSRLSPLDSAVVLSAPPQNPDDFKLYARDIVKLPLHARLVTISACYGSGIRAYAGEGLVGLAWAFLRAGSHNVISALWEVNDDSTPQLMGRLYDEIESGMAPDAALRSAKLSLIRSTGVPRKPFFWAAFQLYAGSG